MFNSFNEYEAPKDYAKERKLTLKNGSVIKIKQFDPYGYWRIIPEKGRVPEELKSEYTSFTEAEKAATRYYYDMKRDVVEVKQGVA
jgi:hypothetical protein